MLQGVKTISENSQAQTIARLDPRVRQTRKSIREAMEALLRLKSLDQITIREITAQAGVGYNTFFRHYQDKDAVLADLAEEEIQSMLELTIPVFKTKDLHAAHLALCHMVAGRHRLWSALLAGAGPSIRSSLIEKRLEAAKQEHPGPHALPRDLRVTLSVVIILETLAWWLQRPRRASPERVATMLDSLITPVIVDALETTPR